MDHGIQTFLGRMSQNICICTGNLIFPDDSSPDRIIHIMMNICDFVRITNHPAFQSVRLTGHLMVEDSVSYFPGQVQPPAFLFQLLHDPYTLFMVSESFTEHLIECPFSGMTKRCVSKIMSQCNGFGQIFIESEGPGNGSRCLRHFQRMGQSGTVMVSLWSKKYLCLVLQSPKGFTMQNPIPVSLINRPDVAGCLFHLTASGISAMGSIRT